MSRYMVTCYMVTLHGYMVTCNRYMVTWLRYMIAVMFLYGRPEISRKKLQNLLRIFQFLFCGVFVIVF